MSTLLEPDLNSLMITSRSFWSMSPCWKTETALTNGSHYKRRIGLETLEKYDQFMFWNKYLHERSVPKDGMPSFHTLSSIKHDIVQPVL